MFADIFLVFFIYFEYHTNILIIKKFFPVKPLIYFTKSIYFFFNFLKFI